MASVAVNSDFDGDGKADIAVWRPGDGVWWVIHSADGSQHTQQWGTAGDIPVPADYDGDGKADFAVWRPSDGTWHVIHSSDGSQHSQQWGTAGDVPVPGSGAAIITTGSAGSAPAGWPGLAGQLSMLLTQLQQSPSLTTADQLSQASALSILSQMNTALAATLSASVWGSVPPAVETSLQSQAQALASQMQAQAQALEATMQSIETALSAGPQDGATVWPAS